MNSDRIKIKVKDLNFFYHNHLILKNVTAEFEENTITAVIGPSGAGKSTFLMILNRLWENIPDTRLTGKVEIKFNSRFYDIYDSSYSLTQLRRSVGMIFQSPNPLPMSIYKNAAFPLKLAGYKDKKSVSAKVEDALKQAYLWNEVKDRLEQDARSLSGGQQQRLCIARALILNPEILLFDEPTSSLDAKAGTVIEELLLSLKEHCTILVVSHYMDQVKRIADNVSELSDKRFVPVMPTI